MNKCERRQCASVEKGKKKEERVADHRIITRKEKYSYLQLVMNEF